MEIQKIASKKLPRGYYLVERDDFVTLYDKQNNEIENFTGFVYEEKILSKIWKNEYEKIKAQNEKEILCKIWDRKYERMEV